MDSWLRAGEQVLVTLPSGITGNAVKPHKGKYFYTRPLFIMAIERPSLEKPSRCQTMSQSWWKHCLEDSMVMLVNCGAGSVFHAMASLNPTKHPAADSCNSGWMWTSGSLTLCFQTLDKYNLQLINFAGWRLSQLYPVPTNYLYDIHKIKCEDTASSNLHPSLLLASWCSSRAGSQLTGETSFLHCLCPPLTRHTVLPILPSCILCLEEINW